MTLQAVVIGTGWAGEGHTLALQAAGVDVIAMCGRTPEPAKAMAAKLGIKDVRFDWLQALQELRPDIVAIATTAAPHREMAEAAVALGCHVMCDKPLGLNAAEARAMLLAVEQAGVKHAYGSTSLYAPVFEHTRTLLANGLIGQLREIEYMEYLNDSPLQTFTWFHQLNQGGGMLNNAFTHSLAQILRITGGEVTMATGEARQLIERVPAGPRLHDFRESFNSILDPEQAKTAEWHKVDADLAYTVMSRIQLPNGNLVSALFQCSSMAASQHTNYAAFYGTEGTLHLTGPFWPNKRIQYFNPKLETWEDIEVPQEVLEAVPQVESAVQRDWNQLFLEFVADIRGEGYVGYPTFHDGCVAAEVIDIVRGGQGWQPVAQYPNR